jgi:hypothetical protein
MRLANDFNLRKIAISNEDRARTQKSQKLDEGGPRASDLGDPGSILIESASPVALPSIRPKAIVHAGFHLAGAIQSYLVAS